MKNIVIKTESPVQTQAIGKAIGQVLPPGTVLAASGSLGAGKTVLAQGLAWGLGIADAVTSPTYIYFNEYLGRLPFCHIDAYRLEHLEEEEIAQIGLEECFLPAKVAYVEWPQFMGAFLPLETIFVEFRPGLDEERSLQFCYNPQTQAWLEEVLLSFIGDSKCVY